MCVQGSEVTFCLQASRDYVGMAVVDGQLRCVYNLGDREAELQVDQTLTMSETQEAVMDRVKFQRYSADSYAPKLPSHVSMNPTFRILALIFVFMLAYIFYINLLSTLILNRIYQFARLNYTRKATSNKPETAHFYDIDGGNSNTLLNLDPENVVFYVGGYPSDFTVSASEAWTFLSGVMDGLWSLLTDYRKMGLTLLYSRCSPRGNS